MRRSPFSAQGLFWVITLTGISLLVYMLWGVFGAELGTERSFRANSYSRSAVGHRALSRVLRAVGVSTRVSRYRSANRAGRDGVLIIAEPQWSGSRLGENLNEMVTRDGPTIVVLPKWEVIEDHQTPGFIGPPGLLREREAEDVLEEIGVRGGRVTHVPEDIPLRWDAGELGAEPTLFRAQVCDARNVTPIVSNQFGWVLAKHNRRNLFILSDPDVISNYGIARGDNSVFAIRMVDFARRDGAGVVIDETLHGFVREPNVFRALFDFPVAFGTLQFGITVLVLLLAACARFGAPYFARRNQRSGKEFLINNVATMLREAGHNRHALERYLAVAVRQVGRSLHLPVGLDENGTRTWLDRQGELRGLRVRYSELLAVTERDSDATAALYQARRIYEWREEMIHGRQSRA